jgi:hypothetical protein
MQKAASRAAFCRAHETPQAKLAYCLGASFFLAASVAALAASRADEAAGEGAVAAEPVEGAGVTTTAGGAGSVTGAGGGVTTTGATSSFFPQATSAAAAINEASRTDDDFFMETPLAMI